MKTFKSPVGIGLLVLTLATPTARCDEGTAAPSKAHLSLFGTLAAAYHDTAGVEFRRSRDQPTGARGNHLDFGTDTALGAQLDVQPSEKFALVVQVQSRLNADNNWTPKPTLAFIRFTPDDAVTLRLGRVGLEMMIEAEARMIGYSYLPVRLAHDIVATIPVEHVDGIDAAYRVPLGDGVLQAQVLYAYVKSEYNIGGQKVDAGNTRLSGVVGSYQVGDLLSRLYYITATVTQLGDLSTLIDALNAVPLAEASTAARDLDNRNRSFNGIGGDLTWEQGPLKLQAAYLYQRVRQPWLLSPNTRAYSLLTGYRLGTLTPYLTYGRAMREYINYSTHLGQINPQLAPLDAAVSSAIANAQMDQRSAGVGLRYDFAANLSTKFQVDKIRAGYSQAVREDQQVSAREKNITLFSATLEFAY